VQTFFLGAKFEDENVPVLFARQRIPFPRLHFFTFSSALNQEIANGSIIGCVVTVGTNYEGSRLDSSKFNVNREGAGRTDSAFVLQDADYKPMVERLIVGRDSFSSATLIQPGALLCRIFHSISTIHWGESDKMANPSGP